MSINSTLRSVTPDDAPAQHALKQVERVACYLGVATILKLLDDGVRFELATTLASRAVPTFREIALGNLPSTAVILIAADSDYVTVHPSQDEAAKFGNDHLGRYVGINVFQLMSEFNSIATGSHHGSSAAVN